jgi:hypothetical protein
MKRNIAKLNHHRLLGFAFLLQAVTALFGSAVLLDALFVEGDIAATMMNIAANPLQLRAGVLVETITAMGIIFLGVMMYQTFKELNPKLATVALGLYIFEGGLLAVSRSFGFSLLHLSQEAVTTGFPEHLQSMGNLAMANLNSIYALHMLPFCVGAILFYLLLDRSRILPRWVSLWGVISVGFTLILTVVALMGVEVPFFLYLPYAPFEFLVGIWLLVQRKKLTPA